MPRQADRPLGALPTGISTWFAAQEPGLLSHRAVRSHLEAYSPHVWPQVTRLTLLYGIAALRKAYGPGQLSLGDLADVVGAWGVCQKQTGLRGLPDPPTPHRLLYCVCDSACPGGCHCGGRPA
jgi:hypothetical protein